MYNYKNKTKERKMQTACTLKNFSSICMGMNYGKNSNENTIS